MTRVRFVAVGELMLDVVVKGHGHDATIRVRPGGSAANAAVWAAHCRAEAAVVSALGRDFAGAAIRAELEDRGVTVNTYGTDATGTFLLVNGERFADASPPSSSGVEDVRADAVLISGYLSANAVATAVAGADAPWLALDAAQLDRLPDVPCLFLNEERATALTGLQAEEAAHALAAGRRLVCVTRGHLGAIGILDGRLERALGPRLDGDDALGAGDAFAAATLVNLAGGATLAHALTEGCRVGGLAAASYDGWPVRK